ncbi:hypothetical protein MIMGU_mgv1a020576mg [Erythranthe guttata]|uniref:Uncharacterized protein n=1 Tax=Erythranthe guttata TaxID=4155 RepID=A0A022RXW8_ERYGU|nr:hypothetical protein MIMGU_mgv1a020576mg [Erythranthe guttata]
MGDDSREQSPDWLRSFQPPTLSTIELSSGSDTPLDYSPVSDDEDGINLSKLFKKEETQASSINDNDDGKVSVVEKSVEDKSSRKSDKVKRTPEKKRKNVDDSMREDIMHFELFGSSCFSMMQERGEKEKKPIEEINLKSMINLI